MTTTELTPGVMAFVDEGLGHASHLVALGDGRALVVDPNRFPDSQLARARELGLEITYSADTHTHADYVSGGAELARRGSTVLAPRAAGLAIPHRALDDGDEIELARYTLRVLTTPGHTPDHVAYLLLDGGRPVALFSGGSLMAGTAGRTDLLGDDRTDELARAQYRSLQRLFTLPDDLDVYPTHGAGSFCSAPGEVRRATTIGHERAMNPLLQAADEATFVERLRAGTGTLPRYFRVLPEVNRRGPHVYGRVPPLPSLTPRELAAAHARGAVVVDTRPITAFAAGHVPGAVSNAWRPAFATWLASTVAHGTPLVFVTAPETTNTSSRGSR
jgi:glyoxylase-like metal-dependent hydrolase (beta-lactamase superfamily II)